MASGPPAGAGAGGDGARERKRWSESKVYTRKSHNKTPKPNPISHPNPNPNPKRSPLPSHHIPANDAGSSHHHPPPPPLPSAASDDDASSLNRLPDPPNHKSNTHHHRPMTGQRRTVTISISSRTRQEVRDLRRRLTAELEQVRVLSRKLEARELQLASAAGYTQSQFSASDPSTPVPAERPPANPEAATVTVPRRQLSISIAGAENSLGEVLEKEKRTPKANQYYRNSDFILGKEKLLSTEGHKKSKANGSKKHALTDTDYSATQTGDKKLYAQALKNCGALLAKLMKHKYGWVFNKPVDVKGLGLHDYLTVIKHPMDLGTVKTRLNKNWYKSPGEFAEDVRLTFRNAMTYNAKGQDVHVMAEQLSQIFEEQWPAVEAEYTYLPHPQPSTKKTTPLDLRMLERSDSTVHPMTVDTKTKPVNQPVHVGKSPSLKKPKAKDPHKRDMTFDEKQRLSNNLQNLPSEKLDNIVQIIKKRNSMMSQHDDEIEVDIDSVDVETLWELDRFVTNYKKSLSKNKRKVELANLAKAKAEQNARERAPERISKPVAADAPKESNTVVKEKEVASSSPVGGEKEDNASRSSSSSSSRSDSGSSSSDSDSESSSAYGSDAAHSPRT